MTARFELHRGWLAIVWLTGLVGAGCNGTDVRTDGGKQTITSAPETTDVPVPSATTASSRPVPATSPPTVESAPETTPATRVTTTSSTTSTTTVAPAPLRPGMLLGGSVAADEPLFFVSDDPAWTLDAFRSDRGWYPIARDPALVLVGPGTIADHQVALLEVGPLGAYRPPGVVEPVRVGDTDGSGIVAVAGGVPLSAVEWPGPDGYTATLSANGLDLATLVELASHVRFEGTHPVFDPSADFRSAGLSARDHRFASADFVSDGGTVVSLSCQNTGEAGLALWRGGTPFLARSVAGVTVARRNEPDRGGPWSEMNGALFLVGDWWCQVSTFERDANGEVPDEVVDWLLSSLSIVDEQTVRDQAATATIQSSDPGGAAQTSGDGVIAHVAEGVAVRLNTDGTRLLVTEPGSLRVIDVASGQTVGEYPVDSRGGGSVFADHDEVFFDGASVRRVATGAQVSRIAPEGYGGGCASFAEDGGLIALADNSGVSVYDTASGDLRSQSVPPDVDGAVESGVTVPFSPWCATVLEDGTRAFSTYAYSGQPPSKQVVVIWDLATGRTVLSVDLERPYVFASLSPDERLIAVGEQSDSRVFGRLLDATTGDVLLELPRSIHAFSADGSRFALEPALGSGTFEIWDATTLTELATIRSHILRPESFSPDGTRLIAIVDGVAEVRDVVTGDLIDRLPIDGGVATHSASFSPDGSEIVTVNTDGTIRILPAP